MEQAVQNFQNSQSVSQQMQTQNQQNPAQQNPPAVPQTPETAEPVKKKSWLKRILIGVVVLFVIGGIYYWLFAS